MKSNPTASPPLDRLTAVCQRWYLTEPLLFGAWTTHRVALEPRIETVRIGGGTIHVNPGFIRNLDGPTLEQVMRFETTRILLSHPYTRRPGNGAIAWEASNLTIQECLRTKLPTPTALERFGDPDLERKSFEFYYDLLTGPLRDTKPCGTAAETSGPFPWERTGPGEKAEESQGTLDDCTDNDNSDCPSPSPGGGQTTPCDSGGANQPTTHFTADMTGVANTELWDRDLLQQELLHELIREIEANQTWGSIPGNARDLILATLRPQVDYRKILRAFRASVLSSKRRLTRMKPSRRYGFDAMGSRRDFVTRLLFAVDVSGSVAQRDIRTAFSIVNRMFHYGIESIDVIWFDTRVRNETPLALHRAKAQIEVDGRGGTDFQPLMNYLDRYRDYDGMIVFTDGVAPVPRRPKNNRSTRIAWLFESEASWAQQHLPLLAMGQPGSRSAFVRAS